MRIVFLGVGAEQLPVEVLSGILKREGHQVGLVYNPSLFDDRFHMRVPGLSRFFEADRTLVEQAVALRPDVIAMSVLTCTYRWGREMAAAIKARTGARVIFGGVHPSAVPEAVIGEPVVDAICIGEGDVAFPEYLRALESGALDRPIGNIWHKREDGTVVKGTQTAFEQDLDSLPFPDKGLYEDEIRIQDRYLAMTGRGCPYRCTFCFNSFWAKLPSRSGVKGGRYVRQRSVENVIAELAYAKRRWGIREVAFEDDVFTVDKEWIQKFSEQYRREIGVPFKCLTHPKYVDADIVRWLKEAGCYLAKMGIQSLDDHYKYKQMKRYEKVGDVAWAIDAFNAAGIAVTGDHILDSPGEGIESQEAARLFYAAHTPSRIATYWMTYFPGLEMTEDALKRGDLTEEDVRRLTNGHVSNFNMSETKDPAMARALVDYAALFRMMPAIPAVVRPLVKSTWLSPLPVPAVGALANAVDVGTAVVTRHPDLSVFAKYYLHQMWRHAQRTLGLLEPIHLQAAETPLADSVSPVLAESPVLSDDIAADRKAAAPPDANSSVDSRPPGNEPLLYALGAPQRQPPSLQGRPVRLRKTGRTGNHRADVADPQANSSDSGRH